MLFPVLRAAAGAVVGASLLAFASPIVGELVATLPPRFSNNGAAWLTQRGILYEEVSFVTADGLTLRGWLIPAARADAPAVVYAPGTGTDQRSGLSLVPALHRAGYQVLLFSYRGHALSEGRRGAFTYGDAESKDLDAAVEFLAARGTSWVGVIGYSVGAASAILSAARNPQIKAVVAVAPFTSLGEVWRSNRPPFVPSFLLDATFWLVQRMKGFREEDVCPEQVIGQIAPRPLLLIHGTQDRRISVSAVRRLYEAAGGPKSLWLVRDATHAGIRTPVLDALVPDVLKFLDSARLASQYTASLSSNLTSEQNRLQ